MNKEKATENVWKLWYICHGKHYWLTGWRGWLLHIPYSHQWNVLNSFVCLNALTCGKSQLPLYHVEVRFCSRWDFSTRCTFNHWYSHSDKYMEQFKYALTVWPKKGKANHSWGKQVWYMHTSKLHNFYYASCKRCCHVVETGITLRG